MRHYYDQVMGTTGVAVAGALITVRVKNSTPGTGALASIFSDDGVTSIAGSTVTSDATGTFSFYAPDGRYDFVVAIAGFTKIVPDIEISDITEANSGDSPATFVSLVTSGAATLNSLTVTNNALVSGNLTVSGTITGGGSVTASGTTNTIAKFTGTSALGNSSITDSGTLVTITQPASLKNQQSKSILYVDQYASWAAALADLPSTGGTLDGRSPSTPTALGTIDVGSIAAVTILLGPMTYTLDHMTLRSGLTVKGMGIENIQGTKIQCVGAANQAPFIMPTSGSAISVQGVHLSDFELEATAANTAQDGFFFDVSVGNLPSGSNLELSKFSRIFFNSFKGSAIHLKGPIVSATSVVQFNDFELLQASPPASSTTIGTCLRMEGAVSQNIFWNFDATQQGGSPTETLIYAGVTNTSDTVGPYSNWFYGTTIQNAAIGALLNGCQACVFRDSHLELDNIGFQIKTPTTWHNNKILLDGGVANGNVATNSGAGRIVDASDSSNNFGTSVEFSRWAIEGAPDKVASGVLAASTVVMRDNTFDQSTPSMITANCVPGFSTSSTTLNTANSHYAFVNGCSGGTVTTLTSGLGVGETLTLYFNAACTFSGGGNIQLVNGLPSPLAFNLGEQVTLINGDQSGSNLWIVQSTTASRANGFFSNIGRTTALGSTAIYTTGATDTLYLFTLHAACKTTVAAATVTPSVSYTDPSGTVQTATLGAATCTTLGAASQTVATTGLQIKAATNVNISATISGSPNYDIRSGIIKLGGN